MKEISVLMLALLTSCTLSFSNVDTHGQAEDVVDSTPTSDVKPSTNFEMPLMK